MISFPAFKNPLLQAFSSSVLPGGPALAIHWSTSGHGFHFLPPGLRWVGKPPVMAGIAMDSYGWLISMEKSRENPYEIYLNIG